MNVVSQTERQHGVRDYFNKLTFGNVKTTQEKIDDDFKKDIAVREMMHSKRTERTSDFERGDQWEQLARMGETRHVSKGLVLTVAGKAYEAYLRSALSYQTGADYDFAYVFGVQKMLRVAKDFGLGGEAEGKALAIKEDMELVNYSETTTELQEGRQARLEENPKGKHWVFWFYSNLTNDFGSATKEAYLNGDRNAVAELVPDKQIS
jgi:hypothetical protein